MLSLQKFACLIVRLLTIDYHSKKLKTIIVSVNNSSILPLEAKKRVSLTGLNHAVEDGSTPQMAQNVGVF